MAKRKRTQAVPLLTPQPADQFVGRRAELDQLVRALQPGRTVTLVGEPGIGKRALAAAAIDRLRFGDEPPRTFPAGVVTLSCNQYPDDHLLLSALARALGGSAYPNLHVSVAALLQGKQLLIVLEDVDAIASRLFEESKYQQIVTTTGDDETGDAAEGASAQGDQEHVLAKLYTLLENGQCGILLTTTDPAFARGEVIELGPLSEAEGRALLAVYAEDVIDNLQDSTQIVDLLGGLPLSLALAGNWMAGQDAPVADLRRVLDKWRLAELPPDERRPAGLAIVVHLSVSEFDRDARFALRLLAMLANAPLPAPMAGAIVSPFEEGDSDEPESDEVVEAALAAMQKSMGILADLVDLGLLVEQGGGLQYRHYLVQQLALKRDSHGDISTDQEFAARIGDLIEHILMFAEMADENDAAIMPGLAAHLLHLQGIMYVYQRWSYVCDIAVRSAGYFTLPGHWYELFDVTKLVYRAVRQLDEPDLLGEYMLGIGLMLDRLGLTHEATSVFAKALEAADESGDEELILTAVEALLNANLVRGDAEGARQAAERLLALANQQDDPQMQAQALTALAQALSMMEDKAAHLSRVVELTEQALELYRRLGDQEALLDAMLNASAVLSMMGDAARALEYGEPALELARQLRNRVSEAAALMSLGENYRMIGEARRALRTFEKALEVARRTNVKAMIALSCWRLANSVEQSGNGRAALKYYEQCLAALDPAEVRDPTPAQVQAKIAALRS